MKLVHFNVRSRNKRQVLKVEQLREQSMRQKQRPFVGEY